MHQLQLAQERADEFVIGIDPQLIEPMFDVRRHILVKEAQRTKCQRQKHRAFHEFENCDGEQSSAAVSVRSFFSTHYFTLIAASPSGGLKTIAFWRGDV
jgi:hypothetical protein